MKSIAPWFVFLILCLYGTGSAWAARTVPPAGPAQCEQLLTSGTPGHFDAMWILMEALNIYSPRKIHVFEGLKKEALKNFGIDKVRARDMDRLRADIEFSERPDSYKREAYLTLEGKGNEKERLLFRGEFSQDPLFQWLDFNKRTARSAGLSAARAWMAETLEKQTAVGFLFKGATASMQKWVAVEAEWMGKGDYKCGSITFGIDVHCAQVERYLRASKGQYERVLKADSSYVCRIPMFRLEQP